MITVHVVAYNEELLMQFMIDHYRNRFPNCHIVVHDNYSTDNTVNIAINNNCEIRPYDTGGKLSDSKYLEIKNNCWKSAKTDWVLVCDVDELLDINESQLISEMNSGATIIKTEGYNMVNLDDNCDFISMKYGVRQPRFDKSSLFNKQYVNEINYLPGCHECSPLGRIQYSNSVYKLYHYKYINIDLMIQKYKEYAARLSDENKKNGWGYHYMSEEKAIRDHFLQLRNVSIKIR